MRSAAVRSIRKINSNVVQNSRRLFSFKFEMTPARRQASEQPEEGKKSPAEEAQKEVGRFRYNVCQSRTSPVEKVKMGDSMSVQKESVKAAIEEQQLQPSMLPEYYQKQMERSVLINPEPDNTEEFRINQSKHQRRFQVSKTCANATLPLKSVKLANPFPEPVKIMMSRTVSDEEKAEQMLAESRSQRHFSDFGGKPASFRRFSSAVRRWYSKEVGSDPDKCKKFAKQKETTACPKMRLAQCPPRARTACDRQAKEIHCKKQEAPYPAYSEFCHEDIDEKPSECKLCPWKADENPNFKQPKAKLHTSAVSGVNKRRGLEIDPTQIEDLTAAEAAKEETEDMRCDLRKPPCERPKNRRCPPTKEELKKKDQEEKKKKDDKKKEVMSADEILQEAILPTQQVQNLLSLRGEKEGSSEQGQCKIKKFKFPKCEPIKRKEEQPQAGKCPTKKKKPKVVDCPPDDEKEGCGVAPRVEEDRRLSLEEDKRRCPKVDLTVYKEDEDRCKMKKKGNTKICPGDLLKRKGRKPQKKTSEVVTPPESTSQQPNAPTP